MGIAELANCRRLIAVRCNLPHVFPSDPAEIQRELNPHMVPLFPTCKTEGEQVPYMAVGNDDSWQRIASGKTEMSGEYIVEAADVGEEEEEEERIDRKVEKKMRRLRFLQNQQFVQTEVQLTAAQEEEDGEEAPSLVSCDEDGDKNLSLSVYLPSSPSENLHKSYEFLACRKMTRGLCFHAWTGHCPKWISLWKDCLLTMIMLIATMPPP